MLSPSAPDACLHGPSERPTFTFFAYRARAGGFPTSQSPPLKLAGADHSSPSSTPTRQLWPVRFPTSTSPRRQFEKQYSQSSNSHPRGRHAVERRCGRQAGTHPPWPLARKSLSLTTLRDIRGPPSYSPSEPPGLAAPSRVGFRKTIV